MEEGHEEGKGNHTNDTKGRKHKGRKDMKEGHAVRKEGREGKNTKEGRKEGSTLKKGWHGRR
jgi:hypothetical protein